MQDQSCSQRFFRVNVDSMAEHSRSSGVFSRRRVAVNGFAAARPPCQSRYPVQSSFSLAASDGCDGWRPLCSYGWKYLSCKSGRGVHCKKKLAPTAPRHPPAYAAETTSGGGDDLAFSHLKASPPKRVGASLVRHTGCISRIFFSPTICIVCRSTYYYYYYYCRTIISPLFCNRQKWPFRLIIFFVPTICMVGAPTGHYLFLFCNCQKLPTEPNHAYFFRLAGLAPLAL